MASKEAPAHIPPTIWELAERSRKEIHKGHDAPQPMSQEPIPLYLKFTDQEIGKLVNDSLLSPEDGAKFVGLKAQKNAPPR